MHCLTFAAILSVILNHALAKPLRYGPVVHRKDFEPNDNDILEHIVLLNSDAPHAYDVLKRVNLTDRDPNVRYIFDNSAFRGFIAHMPHRQGKNLLAMVDIHQVERPVEVRSGSVLTRTSATWGLQRISSGDNAVGNPESTDYTYSYTDPSLGSGVDVYIADTGIYTENILFNGRARMGFSFSNDTQDENGHGTHCAGIAGGRYFGVASDVNLIGVKVLNKDGAGSTSSTIMGMDYVVRQHDKKKGTSGYIGSVLSMSLGLTSVSPVLNKAITAASDAGLHIAVAGGNNAGDACDYSPSSAAGKNSNAIMSVGSIANDGTISSFSDTGSCLDLYAPGEDVLSAWPGGEMNVKFATGTSMAAPHVAGTMAYLIANDPELAANPPLLKSKILSMALSDQVHGPVKDGDKNLLLNNGVTSNSKVKRHESLTSREDETNEKDLAKILKDILKNVELQHHDRKKTLSGKGKRGIRWKMPKIPAVGSPHRKGTAKKGGDKPKSGALDGFWSPFPKHDN